MSSRSTVPPTLPNDLSVPAAERAPVERSARAGEPEASSLKRTGRKQAVEPTRFPRGVSGNPRGRLRGAPNKATQEVRALARRLVEDRDYQASVRQRLRAGEAGALEPLLWHYAYGKPKDAVELTAVGVSIHWISSVDPHVLRKAKP
jgi:hypothetical protein